MLDWWAKRKVHNKVEHYDKNDRDRNAARLQLDYKSRPAMSSTPRRYLRPTCLASVAGTWIYPTTISENTVTILALFDGVGGVCCRGWCCQCRSNKEWNSNVEEVFELYFDSCAEIRWVQSTITPAKSWLARLWSSLYWYASIWMESNGL